MKITCKLKSGDLVKTIRQFPEMVKRDGESILRQEGRGFAKELARFTLPVGLNENAYQKLAAKISCDIHRVIMSPRKLYAFLKSSVSEGFAKGIWSLLQSGDKKRNRTLVKMLASVPVVSQLIVSGRVDPATVRSARTGEWGGVPAGTDPKVIVTSEKAIGNFIKKMQRKIGMAKGGWAAAGRDISGRNVPGIPSWAGYGRHKVGGRGVYVKATNRIRLINEVRHARKALPAAGEQRAKMNAARNLQLSMTRAMNAIAKKQFSKSRKAA